MEIVGLCRDLGHGPFSHVFDNMVILLAREDLPDWKVTELREFFVLGVSRFSTKAFYVKGDNRIK